MIHAQLGGSPRHGFVTTAPSSATGPVRCNPSAIRKLFGYRGWERTDPRLSRSSSKGALNQWQRAAVIEGVNGQMRRGGWPVQLSITASRAQCRLPGHWTQARRCSPQKMNVTRCKNTSYRCHIRKWNINFLMQLTESDTVGSFRRSSLT